MNKLTKTIIGILFLFTVITSTGCVFNINENDECLRCAFKENGREVSEELCTPFYTESEKAAMRARLQHAADSLGVSLTCSTH